MSDKTSPDNPFEDMIPSRSFLEPRMPLDGKTILVTGGTGSFGRKFTETICREFKPKKLIIFSRDELKQYEMAQDFSPSDYPFLRYFIGDVRDEARLDQAMRDVDVVIHAAALKHVPIAEYNPFECIKTNVMGAENVVRAAIKRGVSHVCALSTDKAANPINLYGASKLAADKIFTAAQHMGGEGGPVFSVVRYGNVVGSRGYVIPYFRKLVVRNRLRLLLRRRRREAGADQPKIPSMSTAELARTMAPHLPHKIVGIRPGEKLHEIMVPEDDSRTTVELADRYAILPAHSAKIMARYLATGGKLVPDGFQYASNTNPEQLDGEALRALIGEAAAA